MPADPNKLQRAQAKTSRIPVALTQSTRETVLKKPSWIRIKASHSPVPGELKKILREHNLYTVCEEASCPNLPECFSKGTATFMILGNQCTRRCAFCDVAHGRPDPVDTQEPARLAKVIRAMGLKYVVITSVDRDDLKDGGAAHFKNCIQALRETAPNLTIEILVPDFRTRQTLALDELAKSPADVFNHNLETVPRLYRAIRPGSDYQVSLDLLQQHKNRFPHIPTKSGLMVGLGETLEELYDVIRDLRRHDCNMLTVGQYLQPTSFHAPVKAYYTPEQFKQIEQFAKSLGFQHVASGALVRSSYHADQQAEFLTHPSCAS